MHHPLHCPRSAEPEEFGRLLHREPIRAGVQGDPVVRAGGSLAPLWRDGPLQADEEKNLRTFCEGACSGFRVLQESHDRAGVGVLGGNASDLFAMDSVNGVISRKKRKKTKK